jgi:hypothetical protein
MKLVRFSKLFDLRLIVCSLACLAGSFANAQVSQGNFTLPMQTNWEGAVLTPGAYSYTLNHASPGGIILVRAPGGAATMAMTGKIRQSKPSARSHLLLVTQDGQTSIRELYLGDLAVTLLFGPAKVKHSVLAQTPVVKQYVLVADARR